MIFLRGHGLIHVPRGQVMSSNVQMASTVKGVSGLLATVNRTMNPLEIQRSIQQFQLQNQKIGLAEEMFTEAIEGTMEDIDDLGEADEDAEEIIKKVFEEVNLQIKQSVSLLAALYFYTDPFWQKASRHSYRTRRPRR